MDPSYKFKGYNSLIYSTTLLLFQNSYTVVKFNYTIPPLPPTSNGKDWIININPAIDPPPPPNSTGDNLTAAYHRSISFTLAILTTFFQLKYQQNGVENPFKTHPNTMAAALWATLVYFEACIGQVCFPAASVFIVWSGNVVVASLASLFAPDFVRPLLYGVVVSLSGIESLLFFGKLRKQLKLWVFRTIAAATGYCDLDILHKTSVYVKTIRTKSLYIF